MEIITTTVYRAKDGTMFLKKSDCQAYEIRELQKIFIDELYKEKDHFDAFVRIVNKLISLCDKISSDCNQCPFNIEPSDHKLPNICRVANAFGNLGICFNEEEVKDIFNIIIKIQEENK